MLLNPYSHRIALPLDAWRCLECQIDLRGEDITSLMIRMGEFYQGQVGSHLYDIDFDDGSEELPEHWALFCDEECANLYWCNGQTP